MNFEILVPVLLGGMVLSACACTTSGPSRTAKQSAAAAAAESTPIRELQPDNNGKVQKTDEEWRKLLTPEQFAILRKKGTELAFSGTYWNEHRHGVFRCAGCGLVLFRSETKFESGTGWPSFYQPATPEAVDSATDRTLGMLRDEVTCSRCGGHLGHVFDDGPAPTGKRYCINSVALRFEEQKPSAPETH